MAIKLAIHNGLGSFSDRWVQYCLEHGISYKLVTCFNSDILGQIEDCDGLLWHWVFHDPASQLVARQIILSVEMMQKKVFPNTATCWHYDDKIGQKYLLESIGAPLIPTHVFFHERDSMAWIEKTEFPKVFKLRCGAGSQNVKLVKTKTEAQKLCTKAFGKGFMALGSYFSDAKTAMRKVKNMNHFIEKLQRMPKEIYKNSVKRHFLPRQRGYVYFQDFLPDNKYDTRVTVIGNRAFAFTRKTRPNDFRASGSGDIDYDISKIDSKCLEIAFEVSGKLGAQSLAFDFIFDQENEPRIGEISYCYQSMAVYNCPGHWDNNLNWQEGHTWPEDAIISDFIKEIAAQKNP